MPQLKHLAVVLIAFLTPIHDLLLMTVVLVGVDLFTGIAASLKAGRRLTSSRLGRSVAKVATYLIAISVCFILELIFLPGIPAVKMIASLIGLTEATSIFENLNTLSGQNLLGLLLSQIKGIQDKSDIGPK
jgi:phage-related holin